MGCAIPSRYIIVLRDRGGTIICRMLDETKGGKGVENGRIFSPSVSSRFVSPLELINVFAFQPSLWILRSTGRKEIILPSTGGSWGINKRSESHLVTQWR